MFKRAVLGKQNMQLHLVVPVIVCVSRLSVALSEWQYLVVLSRKAAEAVFD